MIDHRLNPHYDYPRLTGVSGCADPPTRSTADALPAGALPYGLIHQIPGHEPIWIVNQAHATGRRVVVALKGQHNSYYAGIPALPTEGWTNTALPRAGRSTEASCVAAP